ncbi:MAG: hypothetical protein KME11_04965 [Timaviella obliquedivisa GSE-PSE-MK23-08B]|jgi:hypothetical protein|nr:hypothetical protein [Timaviella obliquedivisa GSE-PSE-MK23-08B]
MILELLLSIISLPMAKKEPVNLEVPKNLVFREQLEIRYVLVDDLILLDQNPKLHDIGKLVDSIVENGFLDPPKWDTKLNGGAGGIIEGNGRSEALKWMQEQGREIPRGIAVNEQNLWAAPVIFGCDARSEIAAKRYAIDHNNLVMAGGNFSALDMSRAYDAESYIAMLQELDQQQFLPLTLDGEDLELLLGKLEGDRAAGNGDDDLPPNHENINEPKLGKTNCTCPSCGFEWEKD